MTKRKKNDPVKQAEETVAKQSGLEEAQLRIRELEEAVAKKEEELKESNDKQLRVLAEFDNYRKRVNRERQDIARYGCENLIKNLIPILDNFQRAMEAAGENQDFQNFITGIKMIQGSLFAALQKEGLQPIRALKEKFDPHLHDVMMQVETDDEAEGTVVEEMLTGYKLHDKVIRHSMVKVSKKKVKEPREEKK